MLTILIAEDDKTTRLILSAVVAKIGYTPITVNNGRFAWELLKLNQRVIDLLITGLKMQEMDGYALIEHIRSDEHLRNLPVIVQSAFLGVHETTRLMEKNIDYVLTKPLDHIYLEKCIKKTLLN